MIEGTLEQFREYLYGDEPWREKAKCRGLGPETLALFFPHRGQTQKPAKALCARCPVQEECDAYAMRSKSTYGIWGGKIRRRGPQPDEDTHEAQEPECQ